MNNCPCCKQNINDNEGIIIKDYLFCSSKCLFTYFTKKQIRDFFVNN